MHKKMSEPKRYGIIALALAFMFLFKYVPTFNGLSISGMQVLGIFIGVLILWLFIAIDWPSILALGALAFVPELKFSELLKGAYGNQTFVFLMYTFIVTYALSKTSFIKRVALSFINSKIAAKGPWYFVTLYFASIIFVGCFISPTVLFFVYLPIVEEIYHILTLKKGDKLASMLMMGTVIMCGISSGMTPIAHVFPLIAMGLYEDVYQVSVNYATFMSIAIPVGLLSAIGAIVLFKLILKPDMSALKDFDQCSLTGVDGKLTKREKAIIGIFALVVILWVVPGFVKTFLSSGPIYEFNKYIDSFGTAMPPLIGIVLLSIIMIDGRPLLSFKEAMSDGVSWPSLIMCATTLALGSAITNTDIGITSWLSTNLSPIISSLAPMMMVFIFVLWAALQTNVSSNMVTSTFVTTAALAITTNAEGVNVAGIAILIGIMASYSFATPPAMPCVAVASSSGWTDTLSMMKYGFLAMFVAVLVATFIGYPIALMVL